MRLFLRLRKLNQSGLHHILMPALVFILLFGITGSYLLLKGHAAAASYDFQLGYDRGLCLDNSGNKSGIRNPIIQWSCNNKDAAQQFTLQTVGSNRFLVKDSRGTCVDDSGGGVGTRGHQVAVITWACNRYDHAQVWMWSGSGGYHELKNAYNNGCINDPGYSKKAGTHLIIYSCVNTSNEHWYQTAATTTPRPSPSPAPAPAPSPSPSPTPTPTPTPPSGGTTAATCPSPKPTAPVTGYTIAACEDFNNGFGSFGPYSGGGGGTVVGVGRTPSQCTVTGGILELKQASSGATCGGSMLNFSQRYGYWEVRMRAYNTGSSNGSSPHPVLILWPDTNSKTSEIDYFETDMGTPAHGFLHCISNPSQNCYVIPNSSIDYSQWHVYGFQWTPGGMTGYIDGTKWWSLSNISAVNPPASSHQTIQLDNLSGSTPVRPAEMDVDWAHMYK
jgi:cell division septation protein DedD